MTRLCTLSVVDVYYPDRQLPLASQWNSQSVGPNQDSLCYKSENYRSVTLFTPVGDLKLQKYTIKASPNLASVQFAGADAGGSNSVCASGATTVNQCNGVTAVGSPGYRLENGRDVGSLKVVPAYPTTVQGLPTDVNVSFGVLLYSIDPAATTPQPLYNIVIQDLITGTDAGLVSASNFNLAYADGTPYPGTYLLTNKGGGTWSLYLNDTTSPLLTQTNYTPSSALWLTYDASLHFKGPACSLQNQAKVGLNCVGSKFDRHTLSLT